MNPAGRRILEPGGRVNRFLYAMVTVTGPSAIMTPLWEEVGVWAPAVISFWWIVCAFYTIDALLDSLERWRSRPRGRV